MWKCILPSATEFGRIVAKAYEGWMADRVPRLGASLAFYTLLSMAPMLVVIVAMASSAFGGKAAQGRLVWEIQGLVGLQGAVTIQNLLSSAQSPHGSALATILGLIALFFGASAVFTELRDALNTIWHIRTDECASRWMTVVKMLKDRLFSFAMVLGIGFLLMASLLVNAGLSTMGRYFGDLLPMPEWVLQVAYSVVSFVLITFLFAVLYKMLPDLSIEWKDVALGAALTSVLFTVGRLLIGFYLGKATLLSTYGAAGSLVVVLVWVYYSAQIFFFGAEFTCAYAHRYGSLFRRNLQLQPTQPDAVVAPAGEHETKRESAVIIPETFGEAKRRTA